MTSNPHDFVPDILNMQLPDHDAPNAVNAPSSPPSTEAAQTASRSSFWDQISSSRTKKAAKSGRSVSPNDIGPNATPAYEQVLRQRYEMYRQLMEPAMTLQPRVDPAIDELWNSFTEGVEQTVVFNPLQVSGILSVTAFSGYLPNAKPGQIIFIDSAKP